MVDINYEDKATKRPVILVTLFIIIVVTAIILGKYVFSKAIDSFSEQKPSYSQAQYAVKNMKPVFNLTNLSYVIQEDCVPRYELSDEEKEMIAILAYNEDHSSTESMMCVIQVVLNRVESDKFPNTVEDVIYQKGQFYASRFIGRDTVEEDALDAVERVCMGEDPFDGEEALFFARSDIPSYKIAKNLTLVQQEGESTFYKQD